MSLAGRHHDPRSPPTPQQQRREKIGEQERPDVVGSKLQLDPIPRQPSLFDINTCIVEQHIDAPPPYQFLDLGSCVAYGLMGGKIEKHGLYYCGGGGMAAVDERDDCVELGLRAGGEDEQGGCLRGEGGGEGLAEGVG